MRPDVLLQLLAHVLVELVRLALTDAAEAVGGRAALLVPSLDEAPVRLGRQEPLAAIDADAVAPEPHEARGDNGTRVQQGQQRPRVDAIDLHVHGQGQRGQHGAQNAAVPEERRSNVGRGDGAGHAVEPLRVREAGRELGKRRRRAPGREVDGARGGARPGQQSRQVAAHPVLGEDAPGYLGCVGCGHARRSFFIQPTLPYPSPQRQPASPCGVGYTMRIPSPNMGVDHGDVQNCGTETSRPDANAAWGL